MSKKLDTQLLTTTQHCQQASYGIVPDSWTDNRGCQTGDSWHRDGWRLAVHRQSDEVDGVAGQWRDWVNVWRYCGTFSITFDRKMISRLTLDVKLSLLLNCINLSNAIETSFTDYWNDCGLLTSWAFFLSFFLLLICCLVVLYHIG